MNKTTNHESGPCPNEQITVFDISGADALPFLNNQTVSDLNTLSSQPVLTAICNPKGRILFTLLLQKNDDSLTVAVDTSLESAFSQYITMRRFRQDVQITASDYHLHLLDPPNPTALAFKTSSQPAISTDAFWLWMFHAGMPWITAASAEHFIPQHVNLDQLEAIGFDKGCYPGQEIVARLHFLGKVKKRMQYIQYQADEPQAPATNITLPSSAEAVELCSPSIQVNGVWHAQAIAKV